MNDDRFDALLEKCESPIERELLTKLYPHLSPDHTRELEAQKRERIRRDGTRIRLDFAFPDLQIAICCDGREWHEGNPERFEKDRRESRELQLQSWTVLRFSGREINSDSEMVVDTIQRAIERREWFRNRRTRQQQRTPIGDPAERPPAERPPAERPPVETTSGRTTSGRTTSGRTTSGRTTSGRTTSGRTTSETTTMEAGESENTAETRGWNVRCCFPRLCDCRNACIAGLYFLKAPRQAHLPTQPLWRNYKRWGFERK